MPDLNDVLRASVETFFMDWTPTPENINALPEPLRKYITDLETRADPAGEVRELTIARDAVKGAYELGWREGGEAMRKAIIDEVSGG